MDWSQPVSGAVGGAFGLLGGYLNYKYQTRLAEQQNQYNLDMWKMENEYNSPSAQMRRYEEAGLNPALMYGSVTPGNASSAPQMVTPGAPNFSRDLRELAQAFNIEGIKQAIADTKLKQANAKLAQTEANRAADQYEAEITLGHNYQFDPSSGAFVFNPRSGAQKIPAGASSEYYLLKYLADNFRTNSLLVPRANLIGSQAALNYTRGAYTSQQLDYLLERQKMFAPQLRMLNYQAEHYPTTFWIGTAARGAQAVSPFLPIIF